MSNKVGDLELQTQLLNLLQKTPMPVSIDHLKVGWGTARVMLLELALRGKVIGQKTTKSWIFWIPGSESARNVLKYKAPDVRGRGLKSGR